MAEACASRTHRRQENLPPAGFEDREDHRTPCASILPVGLRFHVSCSDLPCIVPCAPRNPPDVPQGTCCTAIFVRIFLPVFVLTDRLTQVSGIWATSAQFDEQNLDRPLRPFCREPDSGFQFSVLSCGGPRAAEIGSPRRTLTSVAGRCADTAWAISSRWDISAAPLRSTRTAE
jgi:hypothetical protein